MKSDKKKEITVGILLATLIFLLYSFTLSPDINWGDSGKYVLLSKKLTLHINAGYHLLRVILGYPLNFLPVGSLAWRHNLLSAFFGALTVFIFFLIALKLTKNIFCALGSSLSLSVSHNFWHLSVISETYTLYAFFLVLIVYIALHFFETKNISCIYLLSFLLGLSLCSHLLIFFSLIPIAIFVIYYLVIQVKPQPIKTICYTLLSFLIGYSPIIILATLKFHSLGLKGIIYEIFDVRHHHFLFYNYPLKDLLKNYLVHICLFFYQFSLIVFVLFIGVIYSFRSHRFIFFFLTSIILSNAGFIFLYVIPKSPYMSTGIYVIASIFIAYGLKQLLETFKTKKIAFFLATCILFVLIPVVTYNFSYKVVKAKGLNISREVPYRDNARYFLIPWKFDENSASKFAEDVFKLVQDKNSIIISDFTASIVLEYYQEEKYKDRKLNIINIPKPNFDIEEFIDKNIGKKMLYLVGGAPEYRMPDIEKKYVIKNIGALYYIKARKI